MKDILVIGDSCQDVFAYCKCDRICPEVPAPVLNYLYSVKSGGMANNVLKNIQGLNVKCDLLTNSDWHNVTKTRYVDKDTNYMFARVDSHTSVQPISLNDINFDYKIIVISDYDKGFLTKVDIDTICTSHECVFLDTKKILGDWATEAKYIKINHTEYARSKEVNAIDKLLEDKIIRTAGPSGCFFNGNQYNVDEVEVRDVSGAGDSFMAGLVVEYLRTDNIIKSITFANECATSVVQKRGVSRI